MFDGYVRDHAHWTPRAAAVITSTRAYAYAEFNADIDRLGAALAALGLTPASGVISVCLHDNYLTYVLLCALARLQITSSPYNDPGADLRLIDREGSGGEAPGPRLVLLSADWVAAALAAEPRPLPVLEIDPEAVGRVMLSSGTTQAPRRVAMTWRRIEIGNLTSIRIRGAGLVGTWIPLTSIEAMQGFTMVVAAWSLGAAVTARIGVAELPPLLETLPPGFIGCTPAQLRALLSHLPPDFRPCPGWRIGAGGARLPVALAQAARLRITPDVMVTYGATESTFNAVGLAADLDEEPGLMGVTPGGAVMEILDDNGRPVPDGESGEIRVRSERMAAGYIDDPEATAERFRDGWFYTNDVGRRLPNGHPLAGRLVLEGRVDDRMNLGGTKFMPGVLEEAALACPGVLDCAAFAVPDPTGMDQCWLALSVVPGFDQTSLAPHLATYRDLPENRFAWVDEIPRNAMGKVERTKLRDALIAATRGGA